MAKGYKLHQKYGEEVQAALDKIIELTPAHLDAIGIRFGDTAYWNAQLGYIPALGVIIIYSDYRVITDEESGETLEVPGIKVGTGNAYVQDLAFLGDAEAARLAAHIADSECHVNPGERTFWNRKLNVDDNSEVVDGVLILNRN